MAFLVSGTLAHADVVETAGLTAGEAVVTDRNGNVVTDPNSLSKWEDYQVNYHWSIPDGAAVAAGDTATVELPENTVAPGDLSFPLKDDNGDVIGTFTIKAGETTGTITFNDRFANVGTNRTGTLSFYAKGTVTDEEHHFDWAINKTGWVSGKDENGLPSQLTWNVAFNPTGQDVGTVVVTDTLGPNQTLLPDSVYAKTGSYNAAGEFQQTGTITPTVAVNGSQITFTFSNVTTAVDMTYNVKLSNVVNGSNEWSNTAVMDGNSVGGRVTFGGSGTGNGDNEELGSVVLTKQDSVTKDVIAGAVYDLQNAAGEVIQSGLTTDAAGKISLSDMQPGDYQFVETTAPAGYELNSTPIKFTIDTNTIAQTVQVNQVDEKTPVNGAVTLTKKDGQNGHALAGAVYELQDATGKVLQSDLKTDAKGELTVSDLAFGDYQFVETSAPAGYELDATPIKFTVDQAAVTTPVQVTQNDVATPVTGSVKLTKTDAKTGQLLAGAVYELQDATGKVLQSDLKTDANGELTVTDLTAGNYQFVETKAPAGYELNQTPLPFTIKGGDAATVAVTATDDATPVKPEEPGTTEPENPGTTEPEKPGTTEPEKPGTTEPENPGTTEPEKPGTTEPEKPGTTEPEKPGTTEPEKPGTTEPEKPGTTVPGNPGTTAPETPGTPAPVQPGVTAPTTPNTGSNHGQGQSTTGAGKLPQTDETQATPVTALLGLIGLVAALFGLGYLDRKHS
ncbi:SpaA isopeptide-forming pilin-related protein [Lactiplantibacillus carotarum]|uniref:SpaA isopeptide-forming pilin-related protein n=1 Tax=Lactiplantibacillus carotarum TaxID=2993456 RepID=UPI00298EF4ED|nr:SpaA isopeptide-forming pilin-related protein [Lactiplantibacillus carotarum]